MRKEDENRKVDRGEDGKLLLIQISSLWNEVFEDGEKTKMAHIELEFSFAFVVDYPPPASIDFINIHDAFTVERPDTALELCFLSILLLFWICLLFEAGSILEGTEFFLDWFTDTKLCLFVVLILHLFSFPRGQLPGVSRLGPQEKRLQRKIPRPRQKGPVQVCQGVGLWSLLFDCNQYNTQFVMPITTAFFIMSPPAPREALTRDTRLNRAGSARTFVSDCCKH